MFKKLCIVTLMVASLNYVQAESTEESVIELPKDVIALAEKSKECAYWVSEWGPDVDVARKDAIEEKINDVCLAIIEERTKLMDKYKNQPEILEYLQ